MLKFILVKTVLFACWFDFKTSYVEVYHNGKQKRADRRIFQNILCWSLSSSPYPALSAHVSFQNILCWSLSHIGFCFISTKIYFKTSYVEVYLDVRFSRYCLPRFQNILCWSLSEFPFSRQTVIIISKHLMLKFIITVCERMTHH